MKQQIYATARIADVTIKLICYYSRNGLFEGAEVHTHRKREGMPKQEFLCREFSSIALHPAKVAFKQVVEKYLEA